jgi:pyruvate/2-oxoglutarate dehydrogenase complex dihydrolipoamide dehydrogenase (E3) component
MYLRFFSPHFLRWLTNIWMPLGKRVVIIGGAIQGCELAEFLVKRGRKVTIVDNGKVAGEGLTEERKARLFLWFAKKGVEVISEAKFEEITEKGLIIVTKEGDRQLIEADNIVLALPFKPDTGLLKSLEGKVPEIYSIGDCRQPGLILDAIADASRIAYAL